MLSVRLEPTLAEGVIVQITNAYGQALNRVNQFFKRV